MNLNPMEGGGGGMPFTNLKGGKDCVCIRCLLLRAKIVCRDLNNNGIGELDFELFFETTDYKMPFLSKLEM